VRIEQEANNTGHRQTDRAARVAISVAIKTEAAAQNFALAVL